MTATFTHTRMSIASQVERACEKLGMTFALAANPDRAPDYLVDGVRMTPGEAADYLLDGGFAGAFGRATTIVHPDRLATQAAALAAKHAGDHGLAKQIVDNDMPKSSWTVEGGDNS